MTVAFVDMPVVLTSRKIKIGFVFGTRPEAIKLAPLVRLANQFPGIVTPLIISTGQHKGLLKGMLPFFEIKKTDYNLDLMQPDQSQEHIAQKVLIGLGEVIEVEHPEMIVVVGDTSSAFAAALTAFYHRVPVAHVEAGLRTWQTEPFPEEFNRRAISHLAALHFAPTPGAAQNLLAERHDPINIFLTGNPIIDAIDYACRRDSEHEGKKLPEGKFILVTILRRENHGEPLKRILFALKNFAAMHPDISIILPIHLNPHVRGEVLSDLRGHKNIRVRRPLSYQSFIHALRRSYFVISDSRGVQEEVTRVGKPMLCLREVTERPEAVASGNVKLVNALRPQEMVGAMERLISDESEYISSSQRSCPFGDGYAAERMLGAILAYFGRVPKVHYGKLPPKFLVGGELNFEVEGYMAKEWLLRSGIQEAEGGFSSWYDAGKGKNAFLYPEITGYAITALSYLDQILGVEGIEDRAEKAFNWLERIALRLKADVLAFPARVNDKSKEENDYLYAFDSGMILFGLTCLYRLVRRQKYLNVAQEVVNFLSSMYSDSGYFYPYFNPRSGKPEETTYSTWSMQRGAYQAKMAMGLLGFHEITGDEWSYSAALALCRSALQNQEEDGRFYTNLSDTETTHTHPHCYAAEGLLYAAQYLKEKEKVLSDEFLQSAERAVRWLFRHQKNSGGVPRWVTAGEPNVFERSDELAQALRLGCILKSWGMPWEQKELDHLAARLLQFQHVKHGDSQNGGFMFGFSEKGIFLRHLNSWSTMFALQALHMYGEAKRGVSISLDRLI